MPPETSGDHLTVRLKANTAFWTVICLFCFTRLLSACILLAGEHPARLRSGLSAGAQGSAAPRRGDVRGAPAAASRNLTFTVRFERSSCPRRARTLRSQHLRSPHRWSRRARGRKCGALRRMSRTAFTVRTAPAIDASAPRQHRLCLRGMSSDPPRSLQVQPTDHVLRSTL